MSQYQPASLLFTDAKSDSTRANPKGCSQNTPNEDDAPFQREFAVRAGIGLIERKAEDKKRDHRTECGGDITSGSAVRPVGLWPLTPHFDQAEADQKKSECDAGNPNIQYGNDGIPSQEYGQECNRTRKECGKEGRSVSFMDCPKPVRDNPGSSEGKECP